MLPAFFYHQVSASGCNNPNQSKDEDSNMEGQRNLRNLKISS